MTPQDSPEARIAKIRERLSKITPGPWRRGQEGNLRVYGPDGRGEDSGLLANVFKRPENATFIAHAPDDVEYLLSRLHEQAQEIERLRAQALAISASLAEFRIGPCSLPQGVIELGQRAEAAESALAAVQQDLVTLQQQFADAVAEIDGLYGR